MGTDRFAGQSQPFTQRTRAAGQKVSPADVREQTDTRLWHGHFCALGDQPKGGALCNAHATTHYDAVHEGDGGFGVVVDQVVEGVFLGKEVFQLRVAGEHSLVKESDVAPCAEDAKWSRLAHPAKRHGPYPVVLLPVQQNGEQVPDHR